MSDKHTESRNKRYERKKIKSGLKKVTVWIPDKVEIELKQVAEFCCENREFMPDMVRSMKTGQMRKAT